MTKLVLKWIIFLIPSILIQLMCYILAPLVAFNRDSYFKFTREVTQEDYDNEIWFRYFCRVM